MVNDDVCVLGGVSLRFPLPGEVQALSWFLQKDINSEEKVTALYRIQLRGRVIQNKNNTRGLKSEVVMLSCTMMPPDAINLLLFNISFMSKREYWLF